MPATKKLADLCGPALFLRAVAHEMHSGQTEVPPTKVLFITDSEYLFKGITEEIWKWKKDWFNDKELEESWESLNDMVEELEGKGTLVYFWLVNKEDNGTAVEFAMKALDMVQV